MQQGYALMLMRIGRWVNFDASRRTTKTNIRYRKRGHSASAHADVDTKVRSTVEGIVKDVDAWGSAIDGKIRSRKRSAQARLAITVG